MTNSKLAIAVNVQIKVKANSKENIQFSLVWNMPQICFGDGQQMYKRLEHFLFIYLEFIIKIEIIIFANTRFFTRYFPQTNENSSQDIASYSLSKSVEWKTAINKWREPILNNK